MGSAIIQILSSQDKYKNTTNFMEQSHFWDANSTLN